MLISRKNLNLLIERMLIDEASPAERINIPVEAVNNPNRDLIMSIIDVGTDLMPPSAAAEFIGNLKDANDINDLLPSQMQMARVASESDLIPITTNNLTLDAGIGAINTVSGVMNRLNQLQQGEFSGAIKQASGEETLSTDMENVLRAIVNNTGPGWTKFLAEEAWPRLEFLIKKSPLGAVLFLAKDAASIPINYFESALENSLSLEGLLEYFRNHSGRPLAPTDFAEETSYPTGAFTGNETPGRSQIIDIMGAGLAIQDPGVSRLYKKLIGDAPDGFNGEGPYIGSEFVRAILTRRDEIAEEAYQNFRNKIFNEEFLSQYSEDQLRAMVIGLRGDKTKSTS